MPDEPTPMPEDFLAALSKSLRPEVLDECADELAELVMQVGALRKKGRLQLTIEIKPVDRIPDCVEVTAKVKTTPPEPNPVAKHLYTVDGRLQTSDPRQPSLAWDSTTQEQT